NKPFPELWDAVIDSIQYPIYRFISQLVKLGEDYVQNSPQPLLRVIFIPFRQRGVLERGRHNPFDIFHDEKTGADVVDHADKVHEQAAPGVIDPQSLTGG